MTSSLPPCHRRSLVVRAAALVVGLAAASARAGACPQVQVDGVLQDAHPRSPSSPLRYDFAPWSCRHCVEEEILPPAAATESTMMQMPVDRLAAQLELAADRWLALETPNFRLLSTLPGCKVSTRYELYLFQDYADHHRYVDRYIGHAFDRGGVQWHFRTPYDPPILALSMAASNSRGGSNRSDAPVANEFRYHSTAKAAPTTARKIAAIAAPQLGIRARRRRAPSERHRGSHWRDAARSGAALWLRTARAGAR